MSKESSKLIQESRSPFAALPSVSFILELFAKDADIRLTGEALTRVVTNSIENLRERIANGERPEREKIIQIIRADVALMEHSRLNPVINATGVIIHTNLGRTPVSDETAAAMASAASSYVALEIDPEMNMRGGRMNEVATLIRALTGAESTLVVNNNAAAILLALAALAANRGVVVSRGEAIEIGGGFRIPDVIAQSGAHLIEVGTTNRTYSRDYEQAIDENTAALLKVHPSNFQITGFIHQCSVAELGPLAAARHIPIIEDLGSGALIDSSQFGVSAEPTIGQSLADGASIVTASGDKLIGGPQAGIIVGSRELVGKIETHPLARAVRADKNTLAGIAATLRHYANGEAVEKIPVWRMIATPVEALQKRLERLSQRLSATGLSVETRAVKSTTGGGSLPGQELPSVAVLIAAASPDELAKRFRTGNPRVFGRIENDNFLLDLRTVLPEQDETLLMAIRQALT